MPRTKSAEGSEMETQKVEKPSGVLERVFITCDNTYEDVLRYDSQGVKVYFSDEPGKLIKLSDDQMKDLPRDLRVKYDQAIINHDRLSKEDPAWVEIQRKLKINQADYASPMDKIEGNKTKPGLVTRNARIDKIDYWRSKGYEIATPEHMASPTMRQVEGHYEISKMGTVESVLMVTTEANKNALLEERVMKNKLAGERIEEAGKRSLRDAGFKPES